jgi:hypothetical protein
MVLLVYGYLKGPLEAINRYSSALVVYSTRTM